jgi:cysteinyl-tRNA synthetase
MAAEHLGDTFDIHGGGLDLIFPHHENEIAQSRCAHNGNALANYWMHNGFLEISGDKMSKSLGNFFTVRQLLEKYPGEAIRLALLSAHYRQPLDFSPEALDKAKATLDRWYGALRSTGAVASEKTNPSARFDETLLDDLNTPLAIAHMHELVNEINRASSAADLAPVKAQLLAAGEALGLLQQNTETWFKGQTNMTDGPNDTDIEKLIAARIAARKAKNFAEADRIRDELVAKGIILEDNAGETQWRRR